MGDTENITRIEAAIKSLEATIIELRIGRPSKILIVDDDQQDTVMMTKLLDRFRCVVSVCHASDEAVARIEVEHFDFVFLDQRMPRVTGIEILRKGSSNGAKFFIISGFPDSSIVTEAAEFGALFIPKPVSYRLLATFLKPNDRATST